MTEQEEIQNWYLQAEDILDSHLSDDRLDTVMSLALAIRRQYLLGRAAGIFQVNNAPRD